MTKPLCEGDFEEILEEYEDFVQKKLLTNIEDREEIRAEILFQAYLELKRRIGYDGDIRDYLRRCYFNLFKRARHAHYKSKEMLSGLTPVVYFDYASGNVDDSLYFPHHDWLPNAFHGQPADFCSIIDEYFEQISEALTPRQNIILKAIMEEEHCDIGALREKLGYTSEAGFRQIVNRIREKIEEIIRQE